MISHRTRGEFLTDGRTTGREAFWKPVGLLVLLLCVLLGLMGLSSAMAEALDWEPAFWNHVVDSEGSTGKWASSSIDSAGRPGIAYYEAEEQALKYARWNGSTWELSVVAAGIGEWEDVDRLYVSLAYGPGDMPGIAFHSSSGDRNRLEYAYWEGTSWTVEVVDSGIQTGIGTYPSLAFDRESRPCISYHHPVTGLKYAERTGDVMDGWQTQIVDMSGTGEYTSLAFDSKGKPGIAYHDRITRSLNYAHWSGDSWETSAVELGGNVGRYASLAYGPGDMPHIAYYDVNNTALKYAYHDGVWHTSWVDGMTWGEKVGEYAGLALQWDDSLPGNSCTWTIAYYDRARERGKVAIRTDGEPWTFQVLGATGRSGEFVSLAAQNATVGISYFDRDETCLRFAFLDQGPPQVSIDPVPAFINPDFIMTGTSGDDSGVDRVTVTIKDMSANKYWDGNGWDATEVWLTPSTHSPDWSCWTFAMIGIDFADGTEYVVKVVAKDVVGRVSDTAYQVFVFDATSPLAAIADAGYFTESPVVLNGTSSDTPPGAVYQVQIQIIDPSTGSYWNGDGWQPAGVWHEARGTSSWSYEINASTWADGIYIVRARSFDLAGNISPVVQAEFGYDATDPCLVPQEVPEYVSFLDVVSGTASDEAGLVRIEAQVEDKTSILFWNGVGWQEMPAWLEVTGTESWSLDTSEVLWMDGSTYSIRFRAWDVAGRSSVEETSPFVWDTTPPWVSLDPIPDYVNRLTAIGGSAGDLAPGLLNSVQLQVVKDGYAYWDGGTWQEMPVWNVLPGTEAWCYDLPALDNGEYTIKAVSVDEAGNVSVPAQRSFVLDSGLPLVAADPLPEWTNSIPVVTGTAADAYPGRVCRVEVQLFQHDGAYWDGTGWQFEPVWLETAGTETWSHELPALEDGTYFVKVRAIDKAGNVSVEQSMSFLLDRVPPKVSIGPLEGWLTSIAGTAHDSGSGLESVSIAVMDMETGLFWHGLDWKEDQAWHCCGSPFWSFDSSSVPWVGDREYMIIARAVDRAGNYSAETWANLVHDAVIPSVSMQSMAGYLNDLTCIQGTATDGPDGQLSRVEVQIRNEVALEYWNGKAWQETLAWVEVSGTENWTMVMPVLADARYTVIARSVDRAGNLSVPDFVTFVFDTMAPVVSLDRIPLFTSVPRLAGSAYDSGSGLAGIHIMVQESGTDKYWNGASWEEGRTWLPVDGLTTWQYGAAMPEWRDGLEYTLIARAVDRAGNLSETGEAAFTYDISLPTVEIERPPSLVNTLTLISGEAADAGPGHVDRVEIQIKKVAESLWWNGMSWKNVPEWVQVSGKHSWSYEMPRLDDNEYSVVVRAVDAAGNISPEDTYCFRMHTVAPDITIKAMPDFLRTPVVVQGTAQDELGIEAVQVCIENTTGATFWNGSGWVAEAVWLDALGNTTWSYALPDMYDGLHTVYARSVDLAGNFSEASEQSFIYNTSPPTGYGPAQPVDGSEHASIRPLLCSTIAVNQFARFAGGIDGPGTRYRFEIALDPDFTMSVQTSNWLDRAEWVPSTVLKGDKSYFWRVKARDEMGNEGPWSESAEFLTAPVFLISPPGEAVIEGFSGDIKLTVSALSTLDNVKMAVVHVAGASHEIPCVFAPASRSFGIEGFTSSGKALDELDTTFRVVVRYGEADLVAAGDDASRLRLAYWDRALGRWEELPTRIDQRDRTLTATGAHLGEWRILVGPPREGMAVWALVVIILDGVLVSMVAGFMVWRQLGTVRKTQYSG